MSRAHRSRAKARRARKSARRNVRARSARTRSKGSGPDAAQLVVVQYPLGPLAVVAGAGAGKTKVLIYRIDDMVNRLHVRPEHILAVTFSRAAAAEMQTRLRDLLGAKAQRVTVCTLHALGLAVLRRHADAAGLPTGFLVLGPHAQAVVLGDVLRMAREPNGLQTVKELREEIAHAKQRMRSPTHVQQRAKTSAQRAFARQYAAYEQALATQHAVDIDDLILHATRLLETDDDVRRAVQEHHRHLLVDEAQDLNRAQHHLLRALVGAGRSITFVGDDDQAIYGWRGARAQGLRRLAEAFGAAVIALNVNHRSTGNIVAAAACVVAPCAHRIPKALQPAPTARPGAPVGVRKVMTPQHEAEYIARYLQRRHRAGTAWRDMAVLMRSARLQAKVLVEVLAKAGVPCCVVRRSDDEASAALEVRRAWIQIATSPRPAECSVQQVLGAMHGVGDKTLSRLANAARAEGGSWWAAFTAPPSTVTAQERSALAGWSAFARRLRRQAQRTPTPTVRSIARWVTDHAPANSPWVRPWVRRMTAFAEAHAQATLQNYLDATYVAGVESTTDEDAVTLSTIHTAKGLEYDVVVVAGVEVGLLPDRRAQTLRAKDEERRVLYVAMTRARRRLVLTCAEWRGPNHSIEETGPSPFLAGLPAK